MKNKTDFPKVLIVASECSPLSKTGGLADVAGALPGAIAKELAEIRVFTPYHKTAREKFSDRVQHLGELSVPMGGENVPGRILKLELGENIYYLLENEKYFSKSIYLGDELEGEQYAFFCKASLAALEIIDFDPQILHLNDWHTGMIPRLISDNFAQSADRKLKILLTIHNLAFKGIYPHSFFEKVFGISEFEESLKMYSDCGAFLKSGILRADLVNAVSPSYSEEICTEGFGEGLSAELRSLGSRLRGVLNGIDYKLWNPENPEIHTPFNRESLHLKKENKSFLLSECSLSGSEKTPLLGIVGRLTNQKGYGLILDKADELMQLNIRLVVLGSGDPKLEEKFKAFKDRYPDKVFLKVGYDEELALKIYAGADIFLMPSAFEPCGLAQMISMRYGTLPLVRRVGGLKDSVKCYDEYGIDATGFAFDNMSSSELFDTLKTAIGLFYDSKTWKRLQENAMSEDFGLSKMGSEYLSIYRELLGIG